MVSSKFFVSDTKLEPLTISVSEAVRVTGESRSQIYKLIALGELDAVKSGSRTLVVYASIKRRQANLPKAEIKPPKQSAA